MSAVTFVTARPRAADGTERVVRLAGGGTHAPFLRDDAHHWAGLFDRPRFRASIGFGPDGWTGGTVPTTGAIAWMPAEPGRLVEVQDLYWPDAPVIVEGGPEAGNGLGAVARLLTGAVADAQVGDGILTLTVADLSAAIDKPLLGAGFAGTGGLEGPPEATGKPKRRSWGRVFNVEARPLVPSHEIHEVGDPARPLSAIAAVRDKGREGPLAVLGWAGSAAATLDALKAAVPPRGGAVVAPSIACVRWWTTPAGPLTADLVGEGGPGGVVPIASALLAAAGGPPIAGAAAAAQLRPAPAGLHLGTATETAAQALDRLFLGVGLLWILDPAGLVRVREFTWTPTDATPLQARFLGRDRTLPPIARRRVGYRRNERVQTAAEISAALYLEDAAASDAYQLPTPEQVRVLGTIEEGATAGATIGSDLRLPDASVPGRSAIVTGEGTALAVVGQTALATTDPAVVLRPGANLVYNGSLKNGADAITFEGGPYLSADGRFIIATGPNARASLRRFGVSPGFAYSVQATGGRGGAAGAGIVLDFFNATGAKLGGGRFVEAPLAEAVFGNDSPVIAPAGAVMGEEALVTPAQMSGFIFAGKFKVEEGGKPTVFTDDATRGAVVSADGRILTPDGFATEVDNRLARRSIEVGGPLQIDADHRGQILTPLPVTRRLRAIRGLTEVNAQVDWQATFPPTLTGAIENAPGAGADRGTVFISQPNGSGIVKVRGTFPDGSTVDAVLEVNKVNSPAPTASSAPGGSSTGASGGIASVTDPSWTNVTETALAQVTDAGLTVRSSADGKISFSANSEFTGTGLAGTNAAVIARYRQGAGGWSDLPGGERDGTATGYDPDARQNTAGFVSFNPITVGGLAADTDFEVALFARRSSGGGTITFRNSSFTVRKGA